MDVAAIAREVEEYVAAGGWDQTPQLFALVPTHVLLREQPELAGHLDLANPLTPVAQGPLPKEDLAEALGMIGWPESVVGCALAQEIIVLPPGAETQLPEERLPGNQSGDAEKLRQAAADHPQRTEARLVAAIVNQGDAACLMRLRGRKRSDEFGNVNASTGVDSSAGSETELSTQDIPEEIVESADLAPNLVEALRATFIA